MLRDAFYSTYKQVEIGGCRLSSNLLKLKELRMPGRPSLFVRATTTLLSTGLGLLLARIGYGTELSMGRVDPFAGLGWVEIFQFLVGWVGSATAKVLKYTNKISSKQPKSYLLLTFRPLSEAFIRRSWY